MQSSTTLRVLLLGGALIPPRWALRRLVVVERIARVGEEGRLGVAWRRDPEENGCCRVKGQGCGQCELRVAGGGEVAEQLDIGMPYHR